MKALFKILILSVVIESCTTVDNKRIIEYFPSGKVKEERIYLQQDDTLTYIEVTYHENGQVNSKTPYVNNTVNGNLISYHENGKMKWKATAELDSFVGTKISYDSNGSVMQIDSLLNKCFVSDCCCDGSVTRYYPNGQVKEFFRNKNGVRTGITIFYLKGESSRREISYEYGKANGPTTEYYNNCIVRGQYVNGAEEGLWYYMDTLGKVVKTVAYKGGIRTK